jgi:hypothetical protein
VKYVFKMLLIYAVQSSRRVQSCRLGATFSVTVTPQNWCFEDFSFRMFPVLRLISPCMRYILRTTDNPSNRFSIAFTALELTAEITDICLRRSSQCCTIYPRMKRKIDFDISSTRSVAPEAGSSSSGSSSINPWTQRSYSSKYYEILQKRKQLPVYEFKDALEKAVKENQVVIVEGETGSGETLSSLIN